MQIKYLHTKECVADFKLGKSNIDEMIIARISVKALVTRPPDNTQQTCLYGTHMGSATGFGMGPIWVSPYAGCPDGSHMGPI